ncbi:MAG TPA: glycosyltransferase family 2 protein [Acidimicrobiales bacterium]|nr:glycosyltransferase family 2 protein [Acidimicrobiales bacterium]
MALRTLRDPPAHAARADQPSTISGAVLWAGTMAYGGSTVALLAVLSRHASRTNFSAVAALLGLAFVVSLVPAGMTLRSASLVADGRPPPALTPASGFLITAVSLAISPLLAVLLHVPVLAAAIVTVQMVVAIPLAIRQGAVLGRRRFDTLGTNLIIEGIARFVLGGLLGIALGITGLALGLCAGTIIALIVLPEWRANVQMADRPRTSLTATSASLALLGLFVQLDVLIAPSIVARGGATAYDLAAVPSKGVYLALLAIGPIIFPSMRGRPDRRIVLKAASVALVFGLFCTGILVAGRHVIGAVLARPPADPVDIALLGTAMAVAGVTGIAISAGIARGIKHPWPPLAIGIVVMLACWPLRPGVHAFGVVVLVSQLLAMIPCLAKSMRRMGPESLDEEHVMELFAEAGDPFTPAQAIGDLPDGNQGDQDARDGDGDDGDNVAVIIPTYRRPQLLRRLIETVHTSAEPPEEIIVVDNDPDGSVDLSELPAGVQLVRGGFGINVTAARNAGWRAATSGVCIFIDDDNEVDHDCVGALAAACRDETVGLAGPVIYSGSEGRIWCAGLERSKWTGIVRCVGIGATEPPSSDSRWTTAVVPDAYALRRDVLERVGGLDEIAFPMCGEELDLSERVGALGLDRVVVRAARVRHYGNVSEDPGAQLVRSTMEHGTLRAHLMARSRVRVQRRHSRGLPRCTTLFVFIPLWAIGSIVACLRVKAPLRVRMQTIKAILSGIAEGYREEPPS